MLIWINTTNLEESLILHMLTDKQANNQEALKLTGPMYNLKMFLPTECKKMTIYIHDLFT